MAKTSLGPVVKNEKRRFDRVLPDRWWTIKVHYNITTKIFSIPYPPQFNDEFPQYEAATGKTIEDAQAKFDAAIKMWESSSVNVDKVLCYRFPISYTKFKNAPKGKKLVEWRREEVSGLDCEENSLGLGFERCVAYRRQCGEQNAQYFKTKEDNPEEADYSSHLGGYLEPSEDRRRHSYYDDDDKTVEKGARWVKWTQERETLLKNLGLVFSQLIERVLVVESQLETENGMAELMARHNQFLLTS